MLLGAGWEIISLMGPWQTQLGGGEGEGAGGRGTPPLGSRWGRGGKKCEDLGGLKGFAVLLKWLAQ